MLPSKKIYYEYLLKNELIYPSLNILQDRISDFFIEKNNMHTSAYPNHACDLEWPTSETIDVVLFGEAIRILTEIKLWPNNQKFKIWLLCSGMKQIVHDLYEIPLENLGVIPRYTIFPQDTNKSSDHLFNQDQLHFVMSNSYSLSKNVPLVIGVINKLQHLYPSKKIQLSICSPKPEQYLATNEINKYQWNDEPTIRGDLGYQWAKSFSQNDILINFSTNLTEDFGISIAQAQEHGLKLLITDWAAHKEVYGSNIIKVPTSVTGHHIQEDLLQDRIITTTKYLRPYFENEKEIPKIKERNHFYEPQALSKKEIESHSKKFNLKYSQELEIVFKKSFYPENNPIIKVIKKHFN